MPETVIHVLLRATARITFVFFFFAFAGNAVREFWPGSFSSWLAEKRDWLLVAVAASHTFHLGAIILLFQTIGWSRLQWVTLVGGGFVYILIYAIALNAISRLHTGRERFMIGNFRLEAGALYLIWLIFALGFVPRMISGWPVYSLLGSAAVIALVLRIACLLRHKRALASAA
jgi:methionine sulfoxide reductase heme-binding subunit